MNKNHNKHNEYNKKTMTTTIYNIENSRGNIKVVLHVEGEHQLAHIYLNDQIVSELKFKKDQDIDINLIDIIQNDLAHAKTK